MVLRIGPGFFDPQAHLRPPRLLSHQEWRVHSCGLPIISTPNIGDYSDIIEAEKVGVVVDVFDEGDLERSIERIRELVVDLEGTRARCREVAERELCLEGIGRERYLEVYERLLGERTTA